jgi:AcrR family transcriptional regulator
MGVTDQALGLRERKKIQTRDSIRDAAVRLFIESGYAKTTIEQIAEVAEVSPSTFFRYFPTKESVLIADDLNHAMVDALATQPADVPSVSAFRHALKATLAAVSDEEWKFQRLRHGLVISIPEVKAAQYDSYLRTVSRLVEAECRRTHRGIDEFEVRVFIGALCGALMAVIDSESDPVKRMYRALDRIEAGFLLASTPHRRNES